MVDVYFYSVMICIIFLILLSIIDVLTYKSKKGGIPSVITTSLIIIMFIVGDVESGLLGLLFGLLFTDLDLWGGLADTKVFLATCMLFNFYGVFIYSVLVCILAFGSKFLIKMFNKKARKMPFIPIIGFAFVVSIVLNYFLSF